MESDLAGDLCSHCYLLIIGYDKHELPNKDEPTIVRFGIHIHDLYDVSETTMDFSIICTLWYSWNDPRLTVRTVLPTFGEILISNAALSRTVLPLFSNSAISRYDSTGRQTVCRCSTRGEWK